MPSVPWSFLLQGGLDLVTPRRAAKPGTLIACYNHECWERGLHRIDGWERFSGQSKPSEATYHYVPFTAGNQSIVAGTVVTGATSGATGIAVATATLLSGSYGSSNGVGYLGVYVTSGAFLNGEGIRTGGVTRVTASATPIERGAPSTAIDAALLQAEMERRRALIVEPVGTGPIKGVWLYNGTAYCFRQAVGNNPDRMFKATAAGWTLISPPTRLQFNTGTAEPREGETLTRSGVTSTIVRVARSGGSWSGGSAQGYIHVRNIAGGSYTNGIATSASGSLTLIDAPGNPIHLGQGTTYSFRNYSFTGGETDERMYFCSGTIGQAAAIGGFGSYALEFDGTSYSWIMTAHLIQSKWPTHVAVHGNHLWLAFEHGVVLYSSLGTPREFIVAEDSGGIVFGQRATNMVDGAYSSLVITGKDQVSYLTGSSGDDFVMKSIESDRGAKAQSMVKVGPRPFYVDDGGIQQLASSDSFGDWTVQAISVLVDPIFRTKKVHGITCTASVAVAPKKQIRFFFSDGSGLTVYLGRRAPEITPFFLPIIVTCACSGKDAAGNEIVLVGATNGHVYQMDAGPSGDGAAIDAWFITHFVSPDPNYNYAWQDLYVEVDAPEPSTNSLNFRAEYSFGSELLAPSAENPGSIVGIGTFWEEDQWQDLEVVLGRAWTDLNGFGFNIAVAVQSELTYETPYTIESVTPSFLRRGKAKMRDN